MRFQLAEYTAPLSTLLVVTDQEESIRALEFADHAERMHRLLRVHYGQYVLEAAPLPKSIAQALSAYFAGDLHAIDLVRVETGGTPFQRTVWQALRAIKPGNTKSYGQLARELGRVSASRAVGAANSANPVSIVVPCHRVIGANAKLTGYAGGLPRKEWLLAHERGAFAQALVRSADEMVVR